MRACRETPETKDDVVVKELLSKLNRAKANDGLTRRFPKSDRKVGPSEVAFGHGSSSLASLPLPKQPVATTNTKDAAGKIDRASKKGCKLEELQSGFMGKLLVYKSGKVKMKLGDVSPGLCGSFAQDVVAINTKDKRFCVLGEIDRRAVVTPDVDALLDSIDDLD
ncbi:hypothetical protein BHE74_00043642 [Ensete ventricosum]|nr:hypothetical protein BHE74_00043642 [Ensete ventricosum]